MYLQETVQNTVVKLQSFLWRKSIYLVINKKCRCRSGDPNFHMLGRDRNKAVPGWSWWAGWVWCHQARGRNQWLNVVLDQKTFLILSTLLKGSMHIQDCRQKTLNEQILHNSHPTEQTCMNTCMNSYRRWNNAHINYKITGRCKVPAVSISGIAYVIIYEVT